MIAKSTDLEINEKELIDSINNFYSYSKDKNFIDKSLENFLYRYNFKIFPKQNLYILIEIDMML